MKHLDNILLDYTQATHQNCALVYVELEPVKGTGNVPPGEQSYNVYVTNAGCITPIVRRANGVVEWVEAFGLPLGVNAKAQFDYQTVTLTLHPGDVIILSSDGLVETTNPEGVIFGFEQLEQVVVEGPTTTAQAMLTYLQERVSAFSGEADQHDDLTMIVVKV
jgi:serine phosphatase RsbU (regulator of sigma subunit)